MKESVVKNFSYTKSTREVFWLWEEVKNLSDKEMCIEFKWKIYHLLMIDNNISDIDFCDVIQLRLSQEEVRTYDIKTWHMYTKTKYKILEVLNK